MNQNAELTERANNKIAEILLTKSCVPLLDYAIDTNNLELASIIPGDLVIVNFRNKKVFGLVFNIKNSSSIPNLKNVLCKISSQINIGYKDLEFIQKAARYYLSELSTALKLMLPIDISSFQLKNTNHSSICNSSVCSTSSDNLKTQIILQASALKTLSKEQAGALIKIKNSVKPCVLYGVTGSGKTEVYLHLIYDILEANIKQNKNGQVLILLPEISLTDYAIKNFVEAFGFEPVIWNSGVSAKKKRDILYDIIRGDAKVVIGTRSALFLPYKKLDLIVVDEEHDQSYKQECAMPYHARDMAILKASIMSTKILLCSATPSIETMHNVRAAKYDLVRLENRYHKVSMPRVEIIDMRSLSSSSNKRKSKWLSRELIEAIDLRLKKHEQVLLFLNRKGYAPLVLCSACGFRFTCKFCSTWLVLERSKKCMSCHQCGYKTKIYEHCIECESKDSLVACGPGIERIEEEVSTIFQGYKIATISKDREINTLKHSSKKSRFRSLTNKLQDMERGEIDILIGTQVIAKGYHFPNLTLVGIIDADLGLTGGDLRASEKSFQLMQQVSGRAGREVKPGCVILQTHHPNHIIFNCITNNDYEKFIEYEINSRKDCAMPPFTKIASILISAKADDKAHNFAKIICKLAPKIVLQGEGSIGAVQNNQKSDGLIDVMSADSSNIDTTSNNNAFIRIFGPSQSLIHKIAGKYRYKILVVADKKFRLQEYINLWLKDIKIPNSLHLKIDIDPYNFL